MAPRAYWKGFLRLSLVSCPIQLFPATTEREKISFNQINKETGNRIRYRKVDEDTGEEVESTNIIKGYQIEKGQYIEINDEELESITLESRKTIEIDAFVPKSEIDELYNERPYYIAPDGDAGQDAFVVIRNIIEKMNMVAIGRVVLTSREHIVAMQPRGKGIMGTLLPLPSGCIATMCSRLVRRSEEHTSELHHTVISYAVFCLKKKKRRTVSGQSSSFCCWSARLTSRP